MNLIDYRILADAANYYSLCDFSRIETPWWVTEEIMDITKPEGCGSYKIDINDKCLVASGEQSFLYMINKGQLPPGKYQTITPCFRNEHFDSFHSKYFMKLELILLLKNTDLADYHLSTIIADANTFFLKYLETKVVETEQSCFDKTILKGTNTYDIVTKDGLELGSYGVRHCDFATWIYGTGVAEPRFSKAIAKHDFGRLNA